MKNFFRNCTKFNTRNQQLLRSYSTLDTTEPSLLQQQLHKKGIYLDGGATTQIDPRVLDKMLPYQTHLFGNPHSNTHDYGKTTMDAVEVARGQIADLINAASKEIVFTSGATESNNLAIKGVAQYQLRNKGKKHIITTETEHKCVKDTVRRLADDGFEVTYLSVNSDGLINPEELKESIRPDTSIVSIMYVNNEIGVVQPVEEIGKICREAGVVFHTDGAQAVGKLPVDVQTQCIDMMSISGHKVYGPKGIGGLYVRRRRPRVRLLPLINGGGQEFGMRSGTLPANLCIGFGEACAVAKEELDRDYKHVSDLYKRMYNRLNDGLEEIYINGSTEHRYPGNLNISFAYVEGESLMTSLEGIALSSGSACTSASLEPSYVLKHIGVDDELAHTSLRIGFTRFTTEAEVDFVADEIIKHVQTLRKLSPLYYMSKNGIDISKIEWSHH
mmetsp:Transcript_191/g.329  ORF Transcript_191/g.329 Transcript_191/m.329 type:complete len:444 (+) Transcript_191:209-1540(+)